MIEVEDKGLRRACIVTKIFFQGSLVAQEETSYADIIKFERLQEALRELVFELYRRAYKRLLNGDYDTQIRQLIASLKRKDSPTEASPEVPVERFIERRVLPEIAEHYADRYTISKIWELLKNSSVRAYTGLPPRERFRLLCKDLFAHLPQQISEDEKEDLIIKWTKEMMEDEKDHGGDNT